MLVRQPLFQLLTRLLRLLGGRGQPPEAIRDPVHVRIHSDTGHQAPSCVHADVRHFRTHPRQLDEIWNGVGNVTVVLLQENTTGANEKLGLVLKRWRV